MTGCKGSFHSASSGLGGAAAFSVAAGEDCTRASTDSGDGRVASRRVSTGNFSNARGALSSVKEGCKNSSGAISKRRSSPDFLFVAKK